MVIIKLLALLALLGSIIWLVAEPGYEPAVTLIVTLSTLLGTFFKERRSVKNIKQHQKISSSSVGIQAGGDVNISNNDGDKNAK